MDRLLFQGICKEQGDKVQPDWDPSIWGRAIKKYGEEHYAKMEIIERRIF